ncbi:hypothetical protein VCV18_011445 [Metarhizium anisopliae]
MIGRAVTDLPDLKAFTRSHKWIKGALGGQLYKRDPDIALRAGIAKQNLNTVQNAIRAGANLTKSKQQRLVLFVRRIHLKRLVFSEVFELTENST